MMPRFLLKSIAKPASRENPAYLESVTRSGKLVTWTFDPRTARQFTVAQLAKLKAQHTHVKGGMVGREFTLDEYANANPDKVDLRGPK
jgi:hypothetical protein